MRLDFDAFVDLEVKPERVAGNNLPAMVRVLVRRSPTCLVIVYIKGSKTTACKAKINDLQYIAFIVFSINNVILKVHSSSKQAGVWFKMFRHHWSGEFATQWISRRSSYLQHRKHY